MINHQLQNDFEELFSCDIDWIRKVDNSTVFITGATGLIGSVIGRALLFYNENYNGNIKVVCFARNEEKVKDIYRDYFSSQFLDICIGDINEKFIYSNNVGYIIHCANTTSSKEYVEKPVETIQSIVYGTNNVLDFARNKNIRGMVYLSSMEAYGTVRPDAGIISESDYGYIDTSCVRSSYPEGKRLAECLCASYASEYGVRVVIARLAQVFGAGVSTEDHRVFMQLARCALEHKDFIMHSDGSSFGNYCYTTDAVKAIIMQLNKGRSGEIYNVVNEENSMTIRDMAEMVKREIANDSFRVIYDSSVSAQSLGYAPVTALRLSCEKLNTLGWRAEIGIGEMYRRMISSLC